jgi:hypothetical protein
VAKRKLLDTNIINSLEYYLVSAGISSATTRKRWIDEVITHLDAQIDDIPRENLLKVALELVLTILEQQLAKICKLDPVLDKPAIARAQLILLGPEHKEETNFCFEKVNIGFEQACVTNLQRIISNYILQPTPNLSPMQMPIQCIDLRSINLFKMFSA